MLKGGNKTLPLHHPDTIVMASHEGLSSYSQSGVVRLTKEGFHIHLEPMGCMVYVPLTYEINKVMEYIAVETLDLHGANPGQVLPEY